MLRLKACKASLYKLVAEYEKDLPPMRSGTEFIKYSRTSDYALEWVTKDWNHARAFFSTCMGRPLLAIEVRDDGRTVSRVVHEVDLAGLRRRGMVEEFTTAAERRRAGHGGLHSTSR